MRKIFFYSKVNLSNQKRRKMTLITIMIIILWKLKFKIYIDLVLKALLLRAMTYCEEPISRDDTNMSVSMSLTGFQ